MLHYSILIINRLRFFGGFRCGVPLFIVVLVIY